MLSNIWRLPKYQRLSFRSVAPIARRSIAQAKPDLVTKSKNPEDSKITETDTIPLSSQLELPWYLRDDAASPLAETAKVELPAVPESAPKTITSFLELVAKDYGFDNLVLFDMTQLDSDHDYSTHHQPAKYILIASGKSEKHIMKAASQLRTHIKHTYDHLPSIEGMVTGGTSPRARRRMLRRSRKGPMATDNEYGKAANSWVMCETGVDDLFIHMLTADRRQELNLESLWCREEDAWRYEEQPIKAENSDHIFSGIRRFHTMGPFYMATKGKPLQKLLNSDSSVSSVELKGFITDFETSGDSSSKFDFYRIIHLLDPNLVPLKSLTDILFSSKIPKIEAVVAYMKVLMDSQEIAAPEQTTVAMNEEVDTRFDLLLKFVSDLYAYSGEQIELVGHPELVPLLWGLTVVNLKSHIIGSRTIDEAIHNGLEKEHFGSSPSVHIASNRNRDIYDLISSYNEAHSLTPTTSFKEMVLFTYGNAGKWDKFWSTFEVSFNLLNDQEHQNMTKWLRLAVFLDLRNEPIAINTFLNKYWSRSFPSFVTDLETRDFESEKEKHLFKTTMQSMLQKVETPTSAEVQSTIDRL